MANSGRELGRVGSDGVELGDVESSDVVLGGWSSVAGSMAESAVAGSGERAWKGAGANSTSHFD